MTGTKPNDLPPGSAGGPDPADIRKRSVVLSGHRTSISIENAFWSLLAMIAARRGVSANRLIAEVDRQRSGNLSSAVRLFVLREVAAADPAAVQATCDSEK